MENFRRVNAAAAFAELATYRMVGFADHDHGNADMQAGILSALASFMAIGPHRDLCVEYEPNFFQTCRKIAENTGFLSRKYMLDEYENAAREHFAVDPSRVRDIFGYCAIGLMRTLGGAAHPVELPMRQLVPLVQIEHAARQCTSEQEKLALYNEFVALRLAMDPEIAANIWYATRQRPSCIVLGAGHFRPDGIPAHFSAGEMTVVPVFTDAAMMRHELQKAAQNCQTLHPGYHNCVSHAYLANEKIWLKMRAPHAG